MTLTMMRQTYGVQVGNETYSVVATDEDWERRKLERDKQKKLSQETNRRRKALEERKKVAEEREARKRALQLSKRRQRQTEATEKYQRAHLPSRTAHVKSRPLSGHKKTPQLDDVLQQLRSGSTEINYVNGNDEQNLTSTQQMNFSRAKFETKLKEEQQRLLHEHRQTTEKLQQLIKISCDISIHNKLNHILKEFYNGISDSSSTSDRHPSSYNARNQEIIERRQSCGQMFSGNIDIMSGQTTGTYHTLSDYPSNRDYLPESVAKLFVKNEDNNTPHHSSHIDFNQLRLVDADDVMQSPITQPKVYEQQNEPTGKQTTKNNNYEAPFQDDQDSLHGSSSSGTSPVMAMTSFHRKYADDIDYAQRPTIDAKVQSDSTTPNSTYVSTQTQSMAPPETPIFSQSMSTQSSQVSKSSARVASPATYPTWTHQYVATPPHSYQAAHIQSSYATTMANNYYVKSFRPSSAVENKSSTDSISTKSRPKSAILQHTTRSEPVINKMGDYAKEDVKVSKFSDTMVSGRIVNSFAKPNATPISMLYSDAWKKPQQSTPISTPPETTSTPQSLSVSENNVAPKPFTTMSTRSDVTPSTIAAKKDSTVSQPGTWQRKTSDSVPHSPAVKRGSGTAPVIYGTRKGSDTPSSTNAGVIRKASVENKESKDDSDAKVQSDAKFKGILRKVSKYDAPMYHTAAVAARKKWVEHITATTRMTSNPVKNAKLADTEVRDSLDVTKNGNERPKSVRWHEIHYDDGTSTTLADSASSAIRRMPPTPPSVNAVNRPFRSVAERSLRNRTSTARAKPPTFPADRSKKPLKGGRARKLKMSTKNQGAMNPHPPVKSPTQVVSPKTNAQTVPSQSPVLAGGMQSRLQETEITPHRIAWSADERSMVTMENLKSSGSPPPRNQTNGHTVTDSTIAQSRQVVAPSPSLETEHDSSFNLSKTPTDQEINWLWDKVRSCISQRPDSRGLPITKTLSDTGSDRPIFNPSPYQLTSNANPPRASVVSIDGGMFMNNEVQSRTRRMARPSSAVVASAKQRLNTYNASIRRQALLQQRRNKQFGSNRMKHDMVGAPRRYPTPRMSYFNPLPSSGCSVGQVDESTTAFLLAETLAEQNMSEDQIFKAMESLQKKTREAQNLRAQVNPNALSMEEQRLLKSLERLNMRLHEVETATATNPNVNFFKHAQANMGSYSDRQLYTKDIRQQRRSSARY